MLECLTVYTCLDTCLCLCVWYKGVGTVFRKNDEQERFSFREILFHPEKYSVRREILFHVGRYFPYGVKFSTRRDILHPEKYFPY